MCQSVSTSVILRNWLPICHSEELATKNLTPHTLNRRYYHGSETPDKH